MVSFARSTLKKAKEFNSRLEELERTVSLSVIRNYILTGEKPKDVDELTIQKIDELKQLRQDGISGEMIYATAQAESNGLTLTDEIKSGESIVPGFNKNVLEKVPSLQVYQYFMLFTEKELNDYLTNIRNNIESEKHIEEPKHPEESTNNVYR